MESFTHKITNTQYVKAIPRDKMMEKINKHTVMDSNGNVTSNQYSFISAAAKEGEDFRALSNFVDVMTGYHDKKDFEVNYVGTDGDIITMPVEPNRIYKCSKELFNNAVAAKNAPTKNAHCFVTMIDQKY